MDGQAVSKSLAEIRTLGANIQFELNKEWTEITESKDLHSPAGEGILRLIGEFSNDILGLMNAIAALELKEIDLDLIAELKGKLK